MSFLGGRLPVISVSELVEYASRSTARIRLELCPCKELGKLVVRVIDLSAPETGNQSSRLLVDKETEDYFIAGRTESGIRRKLNRYLMPVWSRVEISQRNDGVLRLFQGGAFTEIGNSVMGR